MGKAEGYVEDYLIKQAKAHNHLCFKFISPGIDGVPDRILIGNGKTIFIECKSAVGSLSKQQKKRINDMLGAGADVRKWHTREEIDAYFESLETNRPAKFHSCWDDGSEFISHCTVNTKTREITDIESAGTPNPNAVCIDQYITLDDHTYPVWDPNCNTPKTDAMYCIAEHRKESYYAD